jgi:hypothetical protein
MQISKYAAAVSGVLALAMAVSIAGSEERADGYRSGSFGGEGAMGIFAACRSEKLNARLAQAFRGLDPSFHGRKSARSFDQKS